MSARERLRCSFRARFCQFRGWRASLRLLCLMSWLLAIATLGIGISLWSHGGVVGGSIASITILSGPCKDIGTSDIWIHLGMNIASSFMLAATVSNYPLSVPCSLSLSTSRVREPCSSPCQELCLAGVGCANALRYRQGPQERPDSRRWHSFIAKYHSNTTHAAHPMACHVPCCPPPALCLQFSRLQNKPRQQLQFYSGNPRVCRQNIHTRCW